MPPEPMPQRRGGRSVRPSVSYSMPWAADSGEAVMVRSPAGGRRRVTPRTGGVMGEPDVGPPSEQQTFRNAMLSDSATQAVGMEAMMPKPQPKLAGLGELGLRRMTRKPSLAR